ncbi:MAG: acyl-CoA dehydrogenase family protein [Granulosicoccus sp.]|nr:acyl-CoA dehydrogenase family protein [Granulosicoccus sp.]
MYLEWSHTQQAAYSEHVTFAKEELSDDVVERDRQSVFADALWKKCADKGLLKLPIPTSQGGHGQDILTTTRILDAIGYGCRDNGLGFALGAQIWGSQMALSHFGSADQIATYLHPSMQGEKIAAYAMTEPGTGSDVFNVKTTAEAIGDCYQLNGEKALITFAPIAHYAIVFASTNPQAGQWGLSAFIIDTNTPGLKLGPNEEKMGLRTVPFGKISMNNCQVPRSALLGKEGAGASIFSYSQGWERSLVLAPQLGAMQWQLEHCVDFARNHERFDQSIGQFQSVSHRLADMRLRLETAGLLLYRTADLLQQGQPSLMQAAMTKTLISEAFVSSSQDAIAIFGGRGYTVNQGIERNLRDAIGATIYGGTSNVQRNIIAGLMGL